MKVLVTGGNSAFQRTVGIACVEAGHHVRIIVDTRASGATTTLAGFEPVVTQRPADLRDIARECDVVVAIDPLLTGSRRAEHTSAVVEAALESAGRHGIGRFVLVTRLGGTTTHGDTATTTRHGGREWHILRSASPYGVGHDPVTRVVIMMRSLPAVPVPASDWSIQPVWHDDLARAVAAVVSVTPWRDELIVRGPDRVTGDELFARVAELIDRHPARVPLPDALAARLGFQRAKEDQDDASTATDDTLTTFVHTRLADGLRRLIHELPEISPAEGIGALHVKKFTAVIDSRLDAAALLAHVRARFDEVMPVQIGVEPVARNTALEAGRIVSIALPGRGHVAVRVEEVRPTDVTLGTLRGHVVAGIVRFATEDVAKGVRFEVMTCDRAANIADWITLILGGARAQDANWMLVVKNVAGLVGQADVPVTVDMHQPSPEEAREWERRIDDLLQRHQTVADTANRFTRA